MPEPEQEQKNRELMEALRKMLDAAAQRLTPEVEPAVVYVLQENPE